MTSRKAPVLEWETDVHLVTHPLMLANVAKMFVITAAIMGGLLSFLMLVTGEPEGIAPLLAVTGLTVGGVAVLFLLIAVVFFRNRMRMRFRLDGKGAKARMIDTRAKTANRLAVVAGILGRSPGVAGAGLIAATNTEQATVWKAVAHAHYHKAWRTITLSNGWRTVVTLFCTDANYDAVAAAVARALDARPAVAKAKKSPLPRLLLHTVLIVAATVPLFALPDAEEAALLPAILVLCFAMATLWLIPVLGWAVFAGLAWLAAVEVMAQSESRTSIFGGSYSAYEVMSGDDYVILTAAGIGAAYLVWLCRGLMRGRIRSALGGDMDEMMGGTA